MRLSFLGVLLAACAPNEPAPTPPIESMPAGTVELGRMEGTFTALSDGVELELVPGAQGGFHVELDLRVSGFDPDQRVEVKRDTRRDDTDALIATTTYHAEIGEGGILSKDVPVFLCPAPVGISIADEPLRLRVEVSSDAVGEAFLAFVPRCPTGDQADFCDRICRR